MADSSVMSAAYTVTAPGAVTRPIASPAGGAVSSGAAVTFSTTTAGAEIWYTTNGSDPAKDGVDSTKYANPIPITAAVTIKAIAVKDGMTDSSVLIASYTISSGGTPSEPVRSGDIIIVSYYEIGGARTAACYWKNGVKTDLTGTASYAQAMAIAVDGNDVYISGYYTNGNTWTACYWKNGIRTDLNNYSPDSYNGSGYTTAIAVESGNVYVAGYITHGGDYKACRWVNGSFTLTVNGMDSNESEARAIAVQGGTVYTAGYLLIKAAGATQEHPVIGQTAFRQTCLRLATPTM
jgi:hypothetical protein